jgi:hypothetical protein
LPHSGQNFAVPGIPCPQSWQNFEAAPDEAGAGTG